VTEKDDLSLLDGLGPTDRAKLNAKEYSRLLNSPTHFALAAGPSIRHRAEKNTTMLSRRWQFETERFMSLGSRS